MLKRLRSALVMVGECVRMSLDNIRGNKVRSFLTLLGIMIGITAVIALISTVSGVSGSIASSFADMGVGTLTLNVTGNDLKSGLTADDLKTLSDLKSVDGLVPNVSMTTRVSCRGTVKTDVSVAGRNAYYALLNEDMITQGRALNFIDDDNYSFVCVISQTMVDTFFFGVNPIGETLYVAGLPFTVAGRYEEDSGGGIAAIFSGKPDVIIPYTTALKIGGTGETNNLTVHMAAGVNSEDAKKELEECLDPLFGFEEDCYTITSMESIEETMQTMMGMMSTLLAGIASIALVVGGIGIMNMMLTTVTERTVEIGLKKALGAMPWQIQLQFLIESFMLSLLGGLAGVLTGLLLSYALCQVIGTQFVISGGAIALGVGFSAAVGILFGWAPARKASRLNPIDALRSI
ncbi:MAG: ABC transporter permease [Clostridia bacterium]|nr:ABC transporter permease [Clostridia bacterium]